MAKSTSPKKPKKSIKINWKLIGKIALILVLILLTLWILSLPIYYYWKDFHQFNRSDNPNDWGTFGDFFGGILNPFISLLTLIVTIVIAINISRIEKRNHEETVHSPVKPLFTIGTGDFYSADISQIGPSVERDFYNYTPPQQPAGPHDYLTQHFHLNISNKGLGIATHVNVTFEIDLEALKELLNIDEPRIKVVSSEISVDDDQRDWINLNIQSAHFNYHGSLFKILAKETGGLGVIDKGDLVEVVIPRQMMGAFQLHNLIRRLKNEDKPFPDIYVTLNYRNIHGKRLESKFRVGLVHIHDFAHYSQYRVYQQHL